MQKIDDENKKWINELIKGQNKTSKSNSNEEKRPTNIKKDENDHQIINNNQDNSKIDNNINDKKELIKGPEDTNNKHREEKENEKNPDDAQKNDDSVNVINDIYNDILKTREIRLLTDSQYISLENKIGQNSCFVNVIIHFLYIFPCINDYLIKKYKEKVEKDLKEKEKEKEQNKKEEKGSQKEIGNNEQKLNPTNNNDNNINKEQINKIQNKIEGKKQNKENLEKVAKKDDDFNQFLFDLGKILNDYQNILISTDNNKNKNNIITLNTIQLRKSLSISSNNLFKLNSISDPIELLIYILDLINKENFQEIHNYFHLILIEDTRCSNFCPCKSSKKYDKDNYIYQIYVEDIFNYINKSKLDFDEYMERLFMLSYYSLQNEIIKCEKCNSTMNKSLICNNSQESPKFLLINCVWKNVMPEIEDVIKFLYLISLVEELDNLFICPNKLEKDHFYLMGIIFYSFSLCHYINMIFNLQKNVFTLYNDEGIMEFESICDLYRYLTIGQIRNNNKAYFYPVLLVYGKENIYDESIFPRIKRISKINYEILVLECKEEIKKNEKKNEDRPLTKEEKEKNYQELVLAQIKHDREEEEINNLLNKNQGKYRQEPYDYYKKVREEKESKKFNLNIINSENKNNFLRTNNIKTDKYASMDKNRYNYLSKYNISNPARENERRGYFGINYNYLNQNDNDQYDYLHNIRGNNYFKKTGGYSRHYPYGY